MSLAIALHMLSVTIWVGGMIFAYVILRPVAAEQLAPPEQLKLWAGVFSRFFLIVWISIGLILVSGYYIIFSVYGGMANTPLTVHLMQGLGLIMMAVFGHVYFAPYQHLRRAVSSEDWAEGSRHLRKIRLLVGINSSLGVITIIVASAGKYLL